MAKLLIVDDDLSLRQFLTIFLRKEGHDVEVASNGLRALEVLEKTSFEVVLTDLRMPRMDGLDLLSEIKERGIETQVIVMTAYSSTETALEAMRRGAYDYVIKPFQLDAVRVVIDKCMEKGSLVRENAQLREALKSSGKQTVSLTYCSSAMAEVEGMIARVAPTPSNVLLLGESGTGKEVVARMLHHQSERAPKPF
ncbi:MAG TPA: Fis family transcriptional regulator, partial [Myxococcales bacterium]|nr:Fis family transcriptional regulator [Myxococcales bacterium]